MVDRDQTQDPENRSRRGRGDGRCARACLLSRLDAEPRRRRVKFYEKGQVRIHYQEWGSGFPLLLISGGGLGGSTIGGLTNPFDAVG